MTRTTDFHDFDWTGWPSPSALKPYFRPHTWTKGGGDSWGFKLEGADGDSSAIGNGWPSRINLTLIGLPDRGVLLHYDRWRKASRQRETFYSQGDLSLLLTFVRNLYDDPYSCAFFVPFEQAWLATKQFLEHDGELPSAIEWVDPKTLPKEAFPLP